jgi:hypothetical protein
MASAIRKVNLETLSILALKVSEAALTAEISDGRVVTIPTAWFQTLSKATPAQLQNFDISPGGYGIHWPELDEDISIKSFINP